MVGSTGGSAVWVWVCVCVVVCDTVVVTVSNTDVGFTRVCV